MKVPSKLHLTPTPCIHCWHVVKGWEDSKDRDSKDDMRDASRASIKREGNDDTDSYLHAREGDPTMKWQASTISTETPLLGANMHGNFVAQMLKPQACRYWAQTKKLEKASYPRSPTPATPVIQSCCAAAVAHMLPLSARCLKRAGKCVLQLELNEILICGSSVQILVRRLCFRVHDTCWGAVNQGMQPGRDATEGTK